MCALRCAFTAVWHVYDTFVAFWAFCMSSHAILAMLNNIGLVNQEEEAMWHPYEC